MSESPPIIYTWTDEAPALATVAFLPVIRAFAGAAGVPVETRDISLAGRILAVFPDVLSDEQKVIACLIALRTGAAYVKTSTGFAGGGATVAVLATLPFVAVTVAGVPGLNSSMVSCSYPS